MKKSRNSNASGRAGSNSKPTASKSASRPAASRSTTASKASGSRTAPAKGTKSTGTPARGAAAGKGRAGAPTTRTTGAASRTTTVNRAAATGRNNGKAAAPATKKAATKSAAPARTAAKAVASKSTNSRQSTTGKPAATKSVNSRQAAPARSRAKQSLSHKEGLEKVFKDCMKDIYYAEKRLSSALKKMAKASSNEQLIDAFTSHKEETDGQIEMLNRAFESIGMRAQGKKCEAMDGLLKEADEHIEEFEKGPARDAALIVGGQKVEHYEIAAYGSLKTFASMLGYTDCQEIFEEIEGQEKDADSKLSTVAQAVNQEALQEDGDMGGSATSGGNNSGANTSDNDDLNDADFDDDDDDDDDLSDLGDGDEGADADGADD